VTIHHVTMSPNELNEFPVLLNGVKKTVGKKLMNKITSCKILLVGSGGIGCELLKNLALSGFTHVEVIDLDTIDISNLNRQFLFRRQHVGMPKCTVACEAALAMLPSSKDDAKYIAHHGNVCENSMCSMFPPSTLSSTRWIMSRPDEGLIDYASQLLFR
jgi:molybdopterin/thiamine biosynthesis adenylyltransferase